MGVINVYSVYMDQGGMAEEAGKQTLANLFQHAAQSGLQWLAMGDWNTPPEQMLQADWIQKKGIRVRSTEEATCHPSTGEDSFLDYALMSARLEEAFLQPQVLKGMGDIKTHEAVSMTMLAPADWPDVEFIVAPRRV